ncbi:restriction endonuclease subunit S [uncultured Corynebacterium sp.]|uniref:restriction endonuclease subunit S n=1 Tax=uncultured Corynebacterium sp. TaxID=159447 RepID=UPI002593C022|nr:restriction endonuclease subunit S [uncultured Corynebacterium sp.]
MTKQNVPALRLKGFSGEWENEAVGAFSRLLPHNSLSREQLTDLDTGVSNVHYGDILVKLTAVTTPDGLPFAKDATQFQHLTGHFLNDGDVVFADAAEDLTVGKCTELQDIENKKVVAGLHTIPIHPMRSFGKAFLGYAFNADSFHNRLIPRVQGTKVSSISARTLLETELSIPPTLEEQQAIGAIFTNLDAAINQHTLKHKVLQQAKTALMQRMFPQEGQTVPELRLEGFSGEWKPVRLDAFEIKTGPFGSTLHAEDYVAVGTPIVTTEHFKSGQLPDTGDSIPQVSKQDTARLSMYLLDEGDIVFSRVGSVDINARVTRHQKGWLFSGRVLRLRLDASCDAAFLHSALETEQVRTSIISRAVGQTMPSINTKILGATEVFIPPTLEEQQAIGAVFTQLDTLIAAEAQYIASLKQAKTALLQRMFI